MQKPWTNYQQIIAPNYLIPKGSHDAPLLMLVMEFDGNYEIVIFF
jgi:hypothetical protein